MHDLAQRAAGLPLFERNGTSFGLTAARRQLLAAAERIDSVPVQTLD
jgi:DNA-binding transcriptional LysR family regulator